MAFEIKKNYLGTNSKRMYTFSFYGDGHGETAIPVDIPPEANIALTQLQTYHPEQLLGSLKLRSTEGGKKLYVSYFMPFITVGEMQRPGHGVATALFLAAVEKLAKMHPSAVVRISPEVTKDGRLFFSKRSIDTNKSISINDLHAKIKRYHSSARLRELMKRKIEREGGSK